MTRSPYDVLGVRPNARLETIKRRHRMLAKKHHPDKNPSDPDAAERFREIQQAFDCLVDPEKRAEFDETGKMPDPTKPTLRGDALGILSAVMHQMLQEDFNAGRVPEETDFVARMRGKLEESVRGIAAELQKMHKARVGLEEVAQRFVEPPDDAGVCAAIARAPLTNLLGVIEKNERGVAAHKAAIDLLKTRSFNKKAGSNGMSATSIRYEVTFGR